MCGIAGVFDTGSQPIGNLAARLAIMSDLLIHRGPDGHGDWQHPHGHVGFAHRRLSIIDLSTGDQPMTDGGGNWIAYNGEIYNYRELRKELGEEGFTTSSDTEVILRAYRRWGCDAVLHLRGMFAFALWDEASGTLFCARDRLGIKPFYFTFVGSAFYFASEVKALLPFVPGIETDQESFRDYLAFQFCLDGRTLFKDVSELKPGHVMTIRGSTPRISQYWEVYYHPDFDHTAKYFDEHLRELVTDSVRAHLVSDVPLGAYVSGGLDSSIVATLASRESPSPLVGFTGKFAEGPPYDESRYARAVAAAGGFELGEISITVQDFIDHIRQTIYHLDYPVAGPGSLPQFMVSRLASRSRKVVLGGQGGDEIFGGYARYLIAYFEQCIKAAINGTMHSGNFIVTYESIIPNLTALREYKPLMQEFWRDGLFGEMDERYFRLINRTHLLDEEIDWSQLTDYSPFETFKLIFNGTNVQHESYFDRMTHFDLKTLLPALLHVEDRVSMAHGLEARVPILDHRVVEFAATMPSNIKFENGTMKRSLKRALGDLLPPVVLERTDKMGFPTPFTDWIKRGARDFVRDVFGSRAALDRPLVNNRRVLDQLDREAPFGRKIWGLLCLELWQQEFHDKESVFKARLQNHAALGETRR